MKSDCKDCKKIGTLREINCGQDWLDKNKLRFISASAGNLWGCYNCHTVYQENPATGELRKIEGARYLENGGYLTREKKICPTCGEEIIPGQNHFCVTKEDCRQCMGKDCKCKKAA